MTANELIKDIMTTEHIRQVDLTAALNVSQGRVSTILKSDMQTSTFIRLIHALGYEISIQKPDSDTIYTL